HAFGWPSPRLGQLFDVITLTILSIIDFSDKSNYSGLVAPLFGDSVATACRLGPYHRDCRRRGWFYSRQPHRDRGCRRAEAACGQSPARSAGPCLIGKMVSGRYSGADTAGSRSDDGEWWDASWNPTVGCSQCSPGCDNCYAMRIAARLARMGGKTGARYA